MLSASPLECVETGPLPDDLMAPYAAAVQIAEVADCLSTCDDMPEDALWVLIPTLEKLEIRGDVFTLLTANAQELNSVRSRPASYSNIAYPNAHLVACELWERLLAQAWGLAHSLGLVRDQCCADRFNFDILRLSILKGHERAVRDYFARRRLPGARGLLAELALEVSAAAAKRPIQPQAVERMTVADANDIAMKLAPYDASFVHLPQREWAARIGCSEGTVGKTRLWIATMESSGRGRKDKVKQPRVVSLTDKALASVSQEDADLALQRLRTEAGAEPSPLEDDPPGHPRRVRERKRL